MRSSDDLSWRQLVPLNLFSLKEKRVTELHQCVVLLRESVLTLLWSFKKWFLKLPAVDWWICSATVGTVSLCIGIQLEDIPPEPFGKLISISINSVYWPVHLLIGKALYAPKTQGFQHMPPEGLEKLPRSKSIRPRMANCARIVSFFNVNWQPLTGRRNQTLICLRKGAVWARSIEMACIQSELSISAAMGMIILYNPKA